VVTMGNVFVMREKALEKHEGDLERMKKR